MIPPRMNAPFLLRRDWCRIRRPPPPGWRPRSGGRSASSVQLRERLRNDVQWYFSWRSNYVISRDSEPRSWSFYWFMHETVWCEMLPIFSMLILFLRGRSIRRHTELCLFLTRSQPDPVLISFDDDHALKSRAVLSQSQGFPVSKARNKKNLEQKP